MSSATTLPIVAETVLDDLMTTHKATIPVFIRRRMMCVGCPVAQLHDIGDACTEHEVPLDEFLAELNGVVAGSGRQDAASER